MASRRIEASSATLVTLAHGVPPRSGLVQPVFFDTKTQTGVLDKRIDKTLVMYMDLRTEDMHSCVYVMSRGEFDANPSFLDFHAKHDSEIHLL
jgi:hypothetical protein